MAEANTSIVAGDDDVPDCELLAEPTPGKLRSPTYVLRLLLGTATLGIGLLIVVFYDDAIAGLAYNQRLLLDAFPDVIQSLVGSLGAYALAAVVLAVNAVLLRQRRLRTALTLDLAAVLGAAGAYGAGLVMEALSSSGALDQFLEARFSNQGIPRVTTSPLLGATIAALVLGGPWLSSRWRGAWWWATVGYIAAVSVLSTSGFLGVLIDLGVGTVVGSLVGIVVVTPNRDPAGPDVVATLRRLGMPPVMLQPMVVSSASSVRWHGALADGREVAVKVLGPNRHAANLLNRLWRVVRLKGAAGERSFGSLRREADHAALASLQAHNLGVCTPRVLGFGEVGSAGMLLVTEYVAASDLDTLPTERIERVLEHIWGELGILRRARIAHRRLTPDNIMVDDDDTVWLVDFSGAEVVAEDSQMTDDVVELLGATAALVGPERAVAPALAILGREPLVDALRRLQPLAASSATREALGTSGFKALRSEVSHATATAEPPDTEELSRFSTRRIVTLSMVGAAAYFLVPQLASAGNLWEETQSANWAWAAAAVAFSAASYVGAALALVGGIPNRLSFVRSLLAQVAASFSETITPAKVGGMALNVRFLTKQGVDAAVSASGVGMSVIAGLIVHIVVAASFITAAGRSGADRNLSLPSLTTVLLVAAGLLAVSGLVMLTPWGRRIFLRNLIPALERARDGVVGIATRPLKVASLFGGSLLTTMSYLMALYVSVLAFRGTAGFVDVGVVYLTGAFVASAAPTPGGLGAAEAAYIAGLTAIGTPSAIAVPAVFLFRLATFWLPVAPGWAALNFLRRNDDL
ncbi:MAG: lysylphosphatidylglycerol synthase transmembrane domain-containing protein [Microthrixaceae bacterium]